MSKTAFVMLAPGAEEMVILLLCHTSLQLAMKGKKKLMLSFCLEDWAVQKSWWTLRWFVLKQQEAGNQIIAAICAAPTALAAHCIGVGKSLTSYPSVKPQLVSQYKYVQLNTKCF